MGGQKKRAKNQATPSGIKKNEPKNAALTFRFDYFDSSDPEVCPATFPEGYVQTLMSRLRDLSSWRFVDFIQAGRGLRSHAVDWPDTSRPDGFGSAVPGHLVAEIRPWQFALSQSEGGRVTGFLLGSSFYVVWLDCHHNVYP